MSLYDTIVQAVGALFIIYIFGFVVLPAFATATGQSTLLFTILFILLAISVVISVIVAIKRSL